MVELYLVPVVSWMFRKEHPWPVSGLVWQVWAEEKRHKKVRV